MTRTAIAAVLVLAALAGCAPASSGGQAEAQQPATVSPKRITAAIQSDGTTLWEGTGGKSLLELFSAGLVAFDLPGEPFPQLAEAVPTLENGLWKLFPDGRMETTIMIRDRARWHDGAPVTAADAVFGAVVGKEFPLSSNFGSTAFANIEGIQALDDRSIAVTWKSPYVQANWLFSYLFAPPLPSHLLEESFSASKDTFMNQRFWTTEFVGNGPFVVHEFMAGTSVTLKANDAFILGRPKLDEIEVRFIPNVNTLMANLLTGGIDLTLGTGLSPEQALKVAESWREGTVIHSPYYLTQAVAYPQFVNPEPPILANVQFRRALAHATDREALVQSIQAGVGDVARTLPAPTGPDFKAVERSIVDYEYDPRKAAQLIEGLGYSRGPDGIFRDPGDRELSVQAWGSAGDDVYERTTLAVADFWRRAGVAAAPRLLSAAETQDRAVLPSRPAFQLGPLRTDIDTRFLSSETPLPENSFRGANRARYMNPELDALVARYFVTVARPERERVLADIVSHMGNQAVVIHLFYNALPQMVNRRLKNVEPQSTRAWIAAAHLWDVS